MKKLISFSLTLTLSLALLLAIPSFDFSQDVSFAIEVAPRVSDKEIIEKLAKLEEGQRALQQQINDLKESANKRFDDVNRRFDDVNRRFDDVNKRFDDVNKRFDDVNKRFDTLQWMLGLFITVALSIFGIMGKILWNQQKKLTQIETALEAQKEEISFLKSLIEKLQTLIEKLLPPRGVF